MFDIQDNDITNSQTRSTFSSSLDEDQAHPGPQHMAHDSLIAWYGLDICFALVCLTLIWCIVLCCKIQYGKDVLVTKLTFKPYLCAFLFLLAQFFESITILAVNAEQ